jgi:hypothetical protein
MKRRNVVILSGLAAVAVGWYLFRPDRLVIDERVDESFPVAAAAAASPTSPASSAPAVLASGSFHGNAHETTGSATIYQLEGGRRVLRLADFATSNGPDVRVFLVAASDVTDNDTVKRAGFIELGALKGNIGAQNYDVPTEVDLARYRAVTIWCNRFSVNFGTAPLAAPRS